MVSNANANNIPAYRLHSKFVNNIMDSMILWYDLKRQGATNESMAQTPVLRDLSGNGHDATCYNFAWNRASGIGKYTTDFNNWITTAPNEVINKTDHSFTITKTSGGNEESILYIIELAGILKFRISGLTEGNILLTTRNPSVTNLVITEDGVYEYEYKHESVAFKSNTKRDSCNIIIEQISEYPNALVSDGVDDYAQVLELPLLNREQGYTIIAKRTYLNDTKGCLASYRGTNDTMGPFAMELVELNRTDSFGNRNTLRISPPELITWQRKDSYNGVYISYAGAVFDAQSRFLNIFKLNPGPENFYYIGQIALYSLILFNRDLTDEEIEWVKTNLINYQPLFNVYSFRSANLVTQITYAVNDTLIINTTGERDTWLVQGDINLLKTSFNITCNRPMFLAIADISTDGSTVNKQKKYLDLQVGLNVVPVISDEDLSQYNELIICRPLDDTAGEYIIKAL